MGLFRFATIFVSIFGFTPNECLGEISSVLLETGASEMKWPYLHYVKQPFSLCGVRILHPAQYDLTR